MQVVRLRGVSREEGGNFMRNEVLQWAVICVALRGVMACAGEDSGDVPHAAGGGGGGAGGSGGAPSGGGSKATGGSGGQASGGQNSGGSSSGGASTGGSSNGCDNQAKHATSGNHIVADVSWQGNTGIEAGSGQIHVWT